MKLSLLKLYLISLVVCLSSCSTDTPEKEILNTGTVSQQEDDSEGPPFKHECLCDFKEFGSYKISDEDYNIYLRGKNWDPKLYSCSWIWGEDINNIFPEDSMVRLMKIHLLDLDHFNIPDNGTEYGNDSIKKYVIAVYTSRTGAKNDNCVFDPYKTGKYPKPEQWTE